ncbi:MAG: hypothetical protein DRJ05_00395 [Bacteroidetes bacterium]|nr:MAG: hypothetical protein DRJ05_00395 [Bacteroidota bacterium]
MKTKALAIIATIFIATFLQAQQYEYSWLHPSPQGNAIWSIAFADETTGYAVGGNGVIMKSTDSGDTWTIVRDAIPTMEDLDLYDVVVSAEGDIYSAGGEGKILKSTNYGLSWNELSHPEIASIYDLSANPNGDISCCGTNGKVLMSSDDGASWSNIGIPSANIVKRMYWKSDNECYLVVDLEGFYRSTDAGQNWSLAIDSPFFSNLDIFFVNETKGFATRDYATFTTEDGGETWEDVSFELDFGNHPFATAVLSEDHFFCSSYSEGGFLYETLDGGNSMEVVFEHFHILGFTNITTSPSGRVFFGSTEGGIFYRDINGDFVSTITNYSDEDGNEVNLFKGPGNTLFAYVEPYVGTSSFDLIMQSGDLGENWDLPTNLPFETINDMGFDGETGIVVPIGPTMITHDGAETWQQASLPNNASPIKSSMPSSEKYFLLCSSNTTVGNIVLSSTDSGNNWQASGEGIINIELEGIDISFPTAETGYVLGKTGSNIILYKTENSGESWEMASVPSLSSAMAMDWIDAETGFICSAYYYAPGLFKTTNGGQTWEMISNERFSKVVANNEDNVIAFNRNGNSAAFYESLDGGETFNWAASPICDGYLGPDPPGDNGLCSAVPIEGGWVFGGHGSKIIKASKTITSVRDNNQIDNNKPVGILSISPNPTTGISMIEFEIGEVSTVCFTVYNISGIPVQGPQNIEFVIGGPSTSSGLPYKFLWDAGNLPKGIYFINIKTKSNSSTKKIIYQ